METLLNTMESVNSTTTARTERTFAPTKTGYEEVYGDIESRVTGATGYKNKRGQKVVTYALLNDTETASVDKPENYKNIRPDDYEWLVVCQFRIFGFSTKDDAFAHFKLTGLQFKTCKVFLLQWDGNINLFRASASAQYEKATIYKDILQRPIIGVNPGSANPLTQIVPYIYDSEDDE